MSKYKVEMIVEVNEGHPRKWIPETIETGLEDGEDILEWSIEEISDDDYCNILEEMDSLEKENDNE